MKPSLLCYAMLHLVNMTSVTFLTSKAGCIYEAEDFIRGVFAAPLLIYG